MQKLTPSPLYRTLQGSKQRRAKIWNQSKIKVELQVSTWPAMYKLGTYSLFECVQGDPSRLGNLTFFLVASSLWCSQDSLLWPGVSQG